MSDRDVTCVPDDYTAKLMTEVERLQGENAELRKLVEDMWECAKDYADRLDSEFNGYFWPYVKHGYGGRIRDGVGSSPGFPDRMRELGIEVYG